jgi:hypothetical protein
MARPVPVIRCHQIGSPKTGFAWRFACPYCSNRAGEAVWHTHAPGPGYRAAQCRYRASPYARTGYMLELAAEAPRPDRARGARHW